MENKKTYFCKGDDVGFATNLIVEANPKDLYDTSIYALDMNIIYGELLGSWKMSRLKLVCNHFPKECQATDKELKTSSAFNRKTKENIIILKSFTDPEDEFPVAFVVLSGNTKIVLSSLEVEFCPWV